ncbi:hypothetical protein CIB48_g12339, partial [Xylaria polymorpha]
GHQLEVVPLADEGGARLRIWFHVRNKMNTRGGDARVALPHPEAYNLPIVAFPSCVQREAKLLEDGLPKMLSLDSAVPGLLHRTYLTDIQAQGFNMLSQYMTIARRFRHEHDGCRDGDVTIKIANSVGANGYVVALSTPGHDTVRAKENATKEHVDHIIKFINFAVLDTFPFDDNTFDVVYASQIMAHLPARSKHDEAIRVITEMKRVAKPSGLVASHDLSALHFFPNHLYQLDDLVERTLFKAAGSLKMPVADIDMAGDDDDWVSVLARLLAKGTRLRARWVTAGINETTIETVLERLRDWGVERYSWHLCLFTDITALKAGAEPSEEGSSPEISLSSSGSSSSSAATRRPSGANTPDPGSLDHDDQLLDDQLPDDQLPDDQLPDDQLSISGPPVCGLPVSDTPMPDIP